MKVINLWMKDEELGVIVSPGEEVKVSCAIVRKAAVEHEMVISRRDFPLSAASIALLESCERSATA